MKRIADRIQHASIWWYAFGYFACYWPYSGLAKALTSGLVGSGESTGTMLLPLSVASSLVGMLVFITAMGWWRHAGHWIRIGPLSLPRPGPWTALSGLCTAGIIATTTLAYTFEGVSIVFAMLLMRGGVLIMSPVVDRLTGRRVRWFSWVGLALSFGALVVAFSEQRGWALSGLAIADIAVYLSAYFVRLQLMSRRAKGDDRDLAIRYFVEEQITATPVLLAMLALAAVVGAGSFGMDLRTGFGLWSSPDAPIIVLIGVLSQGTGIFGTLIFLDRNENAYCVPVNRASSILAGVLASVTLWLGFGATQPSPYKMGGAVLVVAAILALSIPPLLERRRAARASG